MGKSAGGVGLEVSGIRVLDLEMLNGGCLSDVLGKQVIVYQHNLA